MPKPWERFQQPQQQPSTSLPNPGDPTEYAGQGQAGTTTPGYYSDEDMNAIGLEMMAGRGSASVINQSPGHQQAAAYAKEEGKNLGELRNTQRGIAPLLRRVDDFESLGRDAGPDVLEKATGPDYGAGHNEASFIPQLLPDTSGQAYQNIREMAQHVNPFSDQESYHKATDLNLKMQHLKDAIAAEYKAVPGGGKTGGTDQAQGILRDMVGHAMHAKDPETFFQIVHDAKNTIRGFGNLDDLPKQQSYIPPGFGAKQEAAAVANDPVNPRLAFVPQPKPAAPPEAITELKANTSAKMRAHFDEVFGEGAAARALRVN